VYKNILLPTDAFGTLGQTIEHGIDLAKTLERRSRPDGDPAVSHLRSRAPVIDATADDTPSICGTVLSKSRAICPKAQAAGVQADTVHVRMSILPGTSLIQRRRKRLRSGWSWHRTDAAACRRRPWQWKR